MTIISKMRTSHRRPAAAGFSLLEVLVAVALLALTLSTIYGMQAQALSLAAEAQFKTNAAFLARTKLAEYESNLLPLGESGDFGDQFPGYSWKFSVKVPEMLENKELSALFVELQQVEVTVAFAGEQNVFTVRAFLPKKTNQ